MYGVVCLRLASVYGSVRRVLHTVYGVYGRVYGVYSGVTTVYGRVYRVYSGVVHTRLRLSYVQSAVAIRLGYACLCLRLFILRQA